MVAPITGPFNKTVSIPTTGPAWYYYKQEKYKQVKPYNLHLPYNASTIITRVGTYGAQNNFNAYYVGRRLKDLTVSSYDSLYSSVMNDARNKAISRFNDKRGQTAAVGVAMAEARESASMIERRLRSTVKAAFAMKKLRFKDAFRHLGLNDVTPKADIVQPVRKSRRSKETYFLQRPARKGKPAGEIHKVSMIRGGSHTFASNWLEVSFGWSPSIDDMYSAMKVLSEGPLYYITPIKVGAGSELSYDALFSSVNYDTKVTHRLLHQVSIAADVRVVNQNYDLWNRMGLANPFAVLWETVPFSFVIDYFVNVGDWLEQFNQDLGVSVLNQYWTEKLTDTATGNNKYRANAQAPWTDNFVDSVATSVSRTVGSLPTIKLGVRMSYHLGLKRAINNVSLLVKLFTKER